MSAAYAKDLTDRMLKTFFQVFVASGVAGQFWSVPANRSALLAVGGALLSAATSVAAGAISKGKTASLLGVLPSAKTKKLDTQAVVNAMVEIIEAIQPQFNKKPAVDPPALPEMATPVVAPLPDLLNPGQ